MLAPNPTQPLTFVDACRLAVDASAMAKGPKRRPRVEWSGVTYLSCCRCPAGFNWHPTDNFERMEDSKRWIRHRSWCLQCESDRKAKYNVRRGHKRRAKLVASGPTVRIRQRHPGSCFRQCRCIAAGAAFNPAGPVVVRLAPKPEPAPKPVPTPRERDGSVPDRLPADYDRARYERLQSLNPALTWAEWVELTTRRKPGRKPQPRGATR